MRRVLSTSTRSLSNFTTKVNSVHAKSPLGCGAPSQPDPVRERRHPTRTLARGPASRSAASANLKSTRPTSFGGGGRRRRVRPRKPQTTITSQGSSAPRHSRTGNSAQAPLHRGRRPRGPGARTESAGIKFKNREKVSREKAPHPRGARRSLSSSLRGPSTSRAPGSLGPARRARALARGPAREAAGRTPHRNPPRARFRAGSRGRPPPARPQACRKSPLSSEPAPA